MLSSDVILPNYKLITFYYHETEVKSPVISVIKNGHLWEKKLYLEYDKILNKESIVIDIGAFIGTHTACFSTLAKEVYAFEPCSKPYESLKTMIKENVLDNVLLFNMAISDKAQEKELMTNYDGDSRFKEHTRSNKFKHCEIIQCRSLDSFNLSKVDLIKIDTEKHEWNVLDGAKETIERCRPSILLETFKSYKNQYKLEEWTKNNNYKYKWLRGDDYLLTPIN